MRRFVGITLAVFIWGNVTIGRAGEPAGYATCSAPPAVSQGGCGGYVQPAVTQSRCVPQRAVWGPRAGCRSCCDAWAGYCQHNCCQNLWTGYCQPNCCQNLWTGYCAERACGYGYSAAYRAVPPTACGCNSE